ncbi:MAG: response regulator [bacterium]|nr:response regulator [bacterium]
MVSILIVDDETGIRELLKKILLNSAYQVYTAESGLGALEKVKEGGVDIVLLDLLLPDMNGVEILKRIKELNPFIEVLMISGHGTIKDGVETIKAGAYDFIQKPFDINLLLAVVTRAIKHRDIKKKFRKLNTDYNRVKRLQEYQENIISTMPIGFLTVGFDDKIVIHNTVIEAMVRDKINDIMNMDIFDFFRNIFSEYNLGLLEDMYRSLKTKNEKFDMVFYNNSISVEKDNLHFRMIGAGFEHGILLFIIDITNEYNTRQQLIQQEKVATLGQFISGVTHGLGNNMANVISNASGIQDEGNFLSRDLVQVTDILKKPSPRSNADREDLIHQIMERRNRMIDYSTRLLKQAGVMNENIKSLLKFSRQPPVVRIPSDINSIIEEAISIVRSYKYNNVKFVSELRLDLPHVSVNPPQIKDVIIDLVLNGIHAMDQKGTITYSTVFQKEKNFIQIQVHDTGKGIDDKIKDKIFSAFFTTRENGTGLGLTNVKNVIKQHNGNIYFQSESGKGTTFFIDIPV